MYVIKTIWDTRTRDIFTEKRIKGIDAVILKKAFDRLVILDASKSLLAVSSVKSNRLEKKEGKVRGLAGYPNKFFAMWVNSQYRILFTWEDNNACNVCFHDYHK